MCVFHGNKEVHFAYFSVKNISCGYSLKAPCQGASNEYPQFLFLLRTDKIMYLSQNKHLICGTAMHVP